MIDSVLGFDLTKNVSLYTVPAAFVLAFIPHTYATIAGTKAGVYDPAYPRKMQSKLAGDNTIDKITKARILRAKAASENAFETLGFFAAAVVAANSARVSIPVLNLLSVGYIVSRALYSFIYIRLQDNRKFAPVRSVMWGLGAALSFTMFVLAAGKLNTT